MSQSPELEIVDYQTEHQPWFEALNRHWIEKYFWMEPIDHEVLQSPAHHIIQHGGATLMASWNREIVGTVALKYVAPGIYEFTKMAVDERFQGKKIGLALSKAALTKAHALRAQKVILYSNTKLVAAIELYKKIGFQKITLDGPYKRSDIKMELILS